MTLSELYLWFCFVIVSLVGLWGICICLSYVAIYLIEKTMRHLEIWKVFVDWIIERRKAQEK